MAETSVPAPTRFNQDGTPPLSYIVAVWLGMPHDDILRGLRDGSVVPPPGASPDWLPPWASGGNSSGGPGDSGFPNPLDNGQTPNGSLNRGGSAQSGGHDARPSTVDRATVQRWFNALDPTLPGSSFDGIWQNAGADDTARAAGLFGYLRRVLLSMTGDAGSMPARRGADDASSAAAALSAFVADPSHRAKVVSLAGKDGVELASLAHTDVGYRYALSHLDPIALTGNRGLFTARNADGSLDRFDPDTGETNLTDAWLTDRGKFLAWKMRVDGGEAATIAGDEDWVFVDRTLRDANGNPMKLQITGVEGSTQTNQVIFGANTGDGEILKGGTGTDRIYGGTGDDVIRGNAGSDHLEGGRGDDLIMGGTGSDELVGGRGNDELDGGAGRDLLQGDSGDDTLTGGTGADWMEGGDGHDTYVIDPGDGADTIVDADGDGEIQFDGETLGGATALADGKYVSADGKVIYSFEGDVDKPGTLRISFYEDANPGANDTPINTVEVDSWTNGDLGIELGGSDSNGDAAPPNATSDTTIPSDAESPSTETVVDASALPETATGGSEMIDGGSAGGGEGGLPAAPGSGGPGNPDALDGVPADLAQSPVASGPISGPFGGVLVNPEIVSRAVRAFAGVPEAPDITAAVQASDAPSSVGVTPQDLSSAMLDFHDSGDLGHDQIGSETLPAPMPALPDLVRTTDIAATAAGVIGVGIGRGSGQRA